MFSDSRALFKFISNKKKSDGYSTTMRLNSTTNSDSNVICDGSFILYEEYFQYIQYIVNKEVNFSIPNISEDMIYTKLKTFSEDMTFGPLPPIVLLKCVRASLYPFPNFLTNP